MDTEQFDRKKHWETIYSNKQQKDVSWYEPNPETSLSFIKKFKVDRNARIIDVGGGDSFFVDKLLELGYSDITVLDISENAIHRAKKRLGEKAQEITWIVADAAQFKPTRHYDFWHDRAAFHFLTSDAEVSAYIETVQKHLHPNGTLVLGTFSESGPSKCSGIDIKQYSEQTMVNKLREFFKKIQCIRVDHQTPFNTIQNFIFCSFKRLEKV